MLRGRIWLAKQAQHHANKPKELFRQWYRVAYDPLVRQCVLQVVSWVDNGEQALQWKVAIWATIQTWLASRRREYLGELSDISARRKRGTAGSFAPKSTRLQGASARQLRANIQFL